MRDRRVKSVTSREGGCGLRVLHVGLEMKGDDSDEGKE